MATKSTERKRSAKSTEVVRAATFGKVVHIPLAQIVANPWQPRRMLDPDRVGELAESIHTHGLLQPPAGRMNEGAGEGKPGVVELVFGHYRVEAIRRLVDAGRWEGDIPMSILELDDAGMFMTALTENSARTDLTQLEQYQAYARALADIEGLTIQALADSIGVDRSTLSNNLRILELPKVALDHVESGEMAPRAARELLCFKAKDHVHETEIAHVIEDIDRTYVGQAPDWRTENVRRLVRDAIRRYESAWRPLERNTGDTVEHGHEGGGFDREPTFDVAAFACEHPTLIHILPRRDGKTRVWTCNVKEWRRWQSAATREANKTAVERGETPPSAEPKSDSGRSRQRQGIAKLAADPLVKSVRAGLPKGDRGTGGNLSTAEREALGVRGNAPVVFAFDAFNETLDDLPEWWPDAAECLERCTVGAAYGSTYQGGTVRLACTNQKGFNDKRSRGLQQLKEALAIRNKAADAEDAQVVEAMAACFAPMVPHVVLATARALLATVDFETTLPEGLNRHSRIGPVAYMPRVLAFAFSTLGVKVQTDPFHESMVDRAASLKALDKLADDSTAVAKLAAQLVTWCIRHTHGREGFERAVKGFMPMDPKDAGVIAPDPDSAGLYYASISADHPTAHIIDGSKPLCGTEALAKSMVTHREVPQKVCARCAKVRAKREAEAKGEST